MPSLEELQSTMADDDYIYLKLLDIVITAKALNEQLIKDGLDNYSVKAERLRRVLSDEIEDLEAE